MSQNCGVKLDAHRDGKPGLFGLSVCGLFYINESKRHPDKWEVHCKLKKDFSTVEEAKALVQQLSLLIDDFMLQ